RRLCRPLITTLRTGMRVFPRARIEARSAEFAVGTIRLGEEARLVRDLRHAQGETAALRVLERHARLRVELAEALEEVRGDALVRGVTVREERERLFRDSRGGSGCCREALAATARALGQ